MHPKCKMYNVHVHDQYMIQALVCVLNAKASSTMSDTLIAEQLLNYTTKYPLLVILMACLDLMFNFVHLHVIFYQ